MNALRPQLIIAIIAIAIQCSNVMSNPTFQSTPPTRESMIVISSMANKVPLQRRGENISMATNDTIHMLPSSMAEKGGMSPTPTLQPTPLEDTNRPIPTTVPSLAPTNEQSFIVEMKEDLQEGGITTAVSSTNKRTINMIEVDVSSYNESCLENSSSDESDVLALSNCQADLANAIANSTANEEKLWKMEKEYVRVLNETYSELDKLEEQVAAQMKQVASWEERYKNTHKKLMEANAELSFSAVTSS